MLKNTPVFLICFILFLSPSSSKYLVRNSLLCSIYSWSFTREFPDKLNCSVRKTVESKCVYFRLISHAIKQMIVFYLLSSAVYKNLFYCPYFGLWQYYCAIILLRVHHVDTGDCVHFICFISFCSVRRNCCRSVLFITPIIPSPVLPLCTSSTDRLLHPVVWAFVIFSFLNKLFIERK